MRAIISMVLSAVLLGACGCDDGRRQHAAALTGGGDPDRGKQSIGQYGCGSCHTIPGVRGADALVGPSLERVGGRAYIGGVLPNNPHNLVRWILNPPAVDPPTPLPNIPLSQADARDLPRHPYPPR